MCMCEKKTYREVVIKITDKNVLDKLNLMLEHNVNITNWFNTNVLKEKI